MRFSLRSSMSVVISLVAFLTVIGGFMVAASSGNIFHTKAAGTHKSIDCTNSAICTEVLDPEAVFGEGNYVGHDEPSVLFYSNKPGSGNRMRYQLTLPNDPSPTNPLAPGKSFNFQLHPAFWFGMAMCDTQSYPEQLSTCTPNSDSNIVDPAVSPNHPGTAFMEMQFYPPGWVSWPAGDSCDATKWCAALNIDSLSQDPVNGTSLNSTCAAVTGVEYVNFAFITKSGTPQPNSPPNPVESTINTFTPDTNADLFMNSGDKLVVTLHDTTHGLRIDIQDLSTGESGSMTTSAANGFGQVKFAPSPSTDCTNIPYDFHPMYSTSSEQTRVPWAAHSYNIAFSDETGHFEACNGPNTITPGASCPAGNTEYDGEPTDANDRNCYPASSSTLVQVPGCFEFNGNTGFDSLPYHHVWPDGNPDHPTSILFTSPLTGPVYNTNYKRMAFEADLPRIEFGIPNPCVRTGPNVGTDCTLIPQTDDGTPADFYPFFSTGNHHDQCTWMLGEDPPGTTNDFGKNSQYGSLLQLTYTGLGGAPIQLLEDFRQILDKNPCKVHGDNID
jgi:hypothetical protein